MNAAQGKALLLLLAGGMLLASCSQLATPRLTTLDIRVGHAAARVEIANTPQVRERGLMYRAKLEPDAGMLFVYPSPRRLSFWMKNTIIPLDIGYFDGDRYLIEVYSMKPQPEGKEEDLKTYTSTEPAQYALEMNPGWFAKHGLKKYAPLRLPREITAVDD